MPEAQNIPVQTADAIPNRLSLEDDSIRSWDSSSRLEWLVTNGIGGYASGTVSGANTRRYHGLLMAALAPPLGRVLMAAGVEETVKVGTASVPLSSDQWWDDFVSPRGFENLASFCLEDGLPVFTYTVGDYLLEKRVWMEDGENLTWAAYSWPADAPLAQLCIKLLLAHRDFHDSQHGSSGWRWRSEMTQNGLSVSAGDGALATVFKASAYERFVSENVWYWGFLRAWERERGLDDTEDMWVPGSFQLTLHPGQTTVLLASAGPTKRQPADGVDALDRERRRRSGVLAKAKLPVTGEDENALVMSADTFLVRRPVESTVLPAHANTVVAGYHWFGDWGRDTMISLPGLALVTGRLEEAREILIAYSTFVSEGMLPYRFPDLGAAPEYNTVDATLHYFMAIHHYLKVSGDRSLLQALYPCLEEIVEWHVKGTRHGIQVDPADGLLRAGDAGSQLTWMDAKVGDWVVTPRMGKPVEIEALWYNALKLMGKWSGELGEDVSAYEQAASRASDSFNQRFPVPGANFLYDVIDTPNGDDAAFRPNQLFAVSLPYPLLPVEKARPLVDECEKRLLTPCGLRSLDPADSRYIGRYGGDQGRRDGAYHQGTVWGWLIGPYVDAVLYAFNDRERAREALEPLLDQLRQAGVGTVSEIFDGDYPHTARGCIAQAWSVGEVLRCMGRLGGR